MGIRSDFTIVMCNGEKLNAIERYDIEKEINRELADHIEEIIKSVIPSYMTYKGSMHRLVGHRKDMVKVLK